MGIAWVQGVVGADGSSTATTSATATFSSGVTTGNLVSGMVVFQNLVNDTNVLSSVKIGSISATLGTAINNTNNWVFLVPFYFPGTAAIGGGTVITATFSTSVTLIRIIADEFSGVRTTSPLDKATGQFQLGPGTQPTSGNVTTTADGELIYGLIDDGSGGGGTWTPKSGFTLLEKNTNGQTVTLCSAWQVQSSAGIISFAATESADSTFTYDYNTAIMTFFVAAAVGPSTATIWLYPVA